MDFKYAKYVLFAVIVVVGVGLDQWTKQYAADRLATSRPGSVQHQIVLDVPESADGTTVEDYLSEEFTRNTPEEVERIADRYVRTSDGRFMRAESKLEGGQRIEVTNRHVVIIPDYWDFQYAENKGAAFGMLADQDSSWRLPFFIIVSLLAVGMIIYIMHGVPKGQWLIVFGLSFIASGAIGNFIDRVRFGYVIDFIVWKYTDAYRWPTFNIADALICIGVALMVIELIRDAFREYPEEGEEAAEEAA
jgi:lipoprotein signal peptidase